MPYAWEIDDLQGYIGGAVLARFFEHPDFASFKITNLVRSPEKAEKLKALGVGVVVGSHSDKGLMESLAADSDVVFAMVSDFYAAFVAGVTKSLDPLHRLTLTTLMLQQRH